jgi:CBS domain-containing protein
MKGHARNLMVERVTAIDASTPLTDIGRTLVATRLGGAPVVDADSRVIGFVSEVDVLDALLRGTDATTPARDIMSHPAIVVDEFATTDDVMGILRKSDIRHLPVVREGRLVGIITPHDVLRFFVEHSPPPQETA